MLRSKKINAKKPNLSDFGTLNIPIEPVLPKKPEYTDTPVLPNKPEHNSKPVRRKVDVDLDAIQVMINGFKNYNYDINQVESANNKIKNNEHQKLLTDNIISRLEKHEYISIIPSGEVKFLFNCAISKKGYVYASKKEDTYSRNLTSTWTNIKEICLGEFHAVGLSFDGKVKSTGDNQYKQNDTYSWSNIKKVYAGGWHTLGLKKDGIVVATGINEFGECNVFSWRDIILK